MNMPSNQSNPNILVPIQVNYHNNNGGMPQNHMMNPNNMMPQQNYQNKINSFMPNRFPGQQQQHMQSIQPRKMFPDQPDQQQSIPIVGSANL
jgi:hypothetical protein